MSRRLLPLLPALFLVASLGCGGKPPAPKTEPTPEPTTPTPTTTKQVDPNAPSGERTFDYWAGIARAQELTARRYATFAEPKPDEVKALLTAAAKGVDELPTEKVDPDALAVGKALADALRGGDAKALTADAAGKARTTRTALGIKYSREFPNLDVATAKEPIFRLARDLTRPTGAQEVARLKGEIAALDVEIKALNKELTDETFNRDKLSGEADRVRDILKEQTSDADLKKARQEVLADAVKDLEASKKAIEALTKKLNPLRTKRGDLNQLAVELDGILKEADLEKAEKLPLDKLERLRILAERLNEKIDAQKEKK